MSRFPLLLAACLAAAPLAAQEHQHTPGMRHDEAAAPGRLVQPGQAAYGAISEVVRTLEADPATDWSKVNVEALRQHLIDMDEVTMRSEVAARAVPGGAEFTVAGAGRTRDAIRRMTANHGRLLDALGPYRVTVAETAQGARMTVTAARPGDAATEARIRGLGFIGLMTIGDHHAPHHEAMARGEMGMRH